MSSDNPNNPAARLLALYNAGAVGPRKTQRSREVWAELLNIPPGDLPLVLKKIGEVAGLAFDIREKVGQLKGLNPENLVTWIPKALQPFTQFNLDVQFNHFLAPVDENVKSLLQICADALSAQLPEPTVDRKQLQELRQQIATFVTSLAQLKMPDAAKAFLMKHVEIIDNALIDYQLKGFDALTAGLERAIGHSALNRQRIPEWEREAPEPFKGVKGLLALYVLLVSAATSTVKLLEGLHILSPTLPAQAEPATKDE